MTSVSCESRVSSCRVMCVGPITRPEESYRVWCVWMCEVSKMRRSWPTRRLLRHKKKGNEILNESVFGVLVCKNCYPRGTLFILFTSSLQVQSLCSTWIHDSDFKICLNKANKNAHSGWFWLRTLQGNIVHTRVGTLIVATIYLQLIQNRYMLRCFTVPHCSHQHCVQPVASDVEVVGYL